jgi:hypothetical protein
MAKQPGNKCRRLPDAAGPYRVLLGDGGHGRIDVFRAKKHDGTLEQLKI